MKYISPDLQTLSKKTKKSIPSKWGSKQAGITSLTSDKIDFTAKLIRRDKSHFILIKGTTLQEDTTLLNTFMKQILLGIKPVIEVISTPHICWLTGSPDRNRNVGVKRHYRSSGPNRYLQDISPKHYRTHILFKKPMGISLKYTTYRSTNQW